MPSDSASAAWAANAMGSSPIPDREYAFGVTVFGNAQIRLAYFPGCSNSSSSNSCGREGIRVASAAVGRKCAVVSSDADRKGPQ